MPELMTHAAPVTCDDSIPHDDLMILADLMIVCAVVIERDFNRAARGQIDDLFNFENLNFS